MESDKRVLFLPKLYSPLERNVAVGFRVAADSPQPLQAAKGDEFEAEVLKP